MQNFLRIYNMNCPNGSSLILFAARFLCIILFIACTLPAKVSRIGNPLPIRQITIRNIAYNSSGAFFIVPNFVSAGSVAFFWVNEQGAIASVPSRLSEKNFIHSSGLFFLRKKKESDPEMAFVSLPELLSGYSVSCSQAGDTIAVAGGNKVNIYSGGKEHWKTINSLTVGTTVTRAVFSPDGQKIAVISDGKMFLFSMSSFALVAAVEPETGSRFADISFSHDNSRCALFEYRNTFMDYASRIRIFDCSNNTFDRDLQYFPVPASSEPGKHFPLVSYGPADSILAVSLPATFSGKNFLVKSNDGSVFKELKGFYHAFSPDGTLYCAQNVLFSTKDWTQIGKIPSSTISCVFSPTERVIISVTTENISRFRIEE